MLWAFAAAAVKLMKMFSWFAGALFYLHVFFEVTASEKLETNILLKLLEECLLNIKKTLAKHTETIQNDCVNICHGTCAAL